MIKTNLVRTIHLIILLMTLPASTYAVDSDSLRIIIDAAESGNPEAQNDLGSFYFNGDGVEQDYTEAIRLYKLSAAQGNITAKYNLGYMLVNGIGFEINMLKGIDYLNQACQGGDLDAAYILGQIAQNGFDDVEPDYQTAYDLYYSGASQGHADCTYAIGEMFRYGTGTDQDFDEAREAYIVAIELGSSDAPLALANLIRETEGITPETEQRINELLMIAAEAGNTEAQEQLGINPDNTSEKSSIWDSLQKTDSNQTQDTPQVSESSEGTIFQPGDWEASLWTDGQLFTSAIVTLATMKAEDIGFESIHKNTFGSPLSMISIGIRGREAGDIARVEISSTQLINPSTMEAVLDDPDQVYQLNPHLLFKYEKLLSIHQTYPEDIKIKVFLNDNKIGEINETVIVRPINDCFYGRNNPSTGEYEDWSEMFAAYVNEDHPVVDKILAEAFRQGYIDSFAGYQGGKEDVLNEINAVWRVLQDIGVKYSNINTTSAQSEVILSQHVRMIGDSIETSQANCADGSVLLASIFRKLGLNSYIVLIPGHMMTGVDLDPEGEDFIIIETTAISGAPLDEAIQIGDTNINEYSDDSIIVNINAARSINILPIREID